MDKELFVFPFPPVLLLCDSITTDTEESDAFAEQSLW